MAKDTFYFTHDYNSRNDIKIKKLISKHGYLGYGIFWAIIEELYNNNNALPIDFECIAFDLRCDSDLVNSIVADFDLFVFEGTNFGSLSVQKRLDDRAEKSKNGRERAKSRWDKTHTEARIKAENCIFYIIKIYNDVESFIKVGITTESISRRYSGKLNNYKLQVLNQCETSVANGLRMESEICEKVAKHIPQLKFAGYLECFKLSDYETILSFAMQDDAFRNAIKERKGKERKETKESVLNYDFIEDKFKPAFREWVKYKTEIKKPFYIQSVLEASYRELKELSKDSALEALKIVQYSVANNYLSLNKKETRNAPIPTKLQGTI